jgi:hypothetical protein
LYREDPPFGGHHSRYKALQDLQKQAIPLKKFSHYYPSRYKALQDLQKQANSFFYFLFVLPLPLQRITRPAEAGNFFEKSSM